jgi:hypothetical protein
MGEFRYNPANQSRFPSSNATPNTLPASYPHMPQYYPYPEQKNVFPLSNQPTAMHSPRSLSYTPVHNAGPFRPSTPLQQLFPSQAPLPPIGHGRPSSTAIYEGYQPVQTADGFSNKKSSWALKPFHTYKNPFSESLKEAVFQDFVRQQRANGANKVQPGDVWLQRQSSTSHSGPRPDVPPPRAFRKASNQLDFQAEQLETRNRPGDATLPRGIFKKRRNSVAPKKAAVAASAAIARVAKMDFESESDEADVKPPKRSWAQVVSSPIKDEQTEDKIALHNAPRKTYSPAKEVKISQSGNQNWARKLLRTKPFLV